MADLTSKQLEDSGAKLRRFDLHKIDLSYCLGCFECWVRTPGQCRVCDAISTISPYYVHAQLVVYVTRVTFGGYSAPLKKAVDRLIPILSPFFKKIEGETHHHPRYDHYPSLFALGITDDPGPSPAHAIFHALLKRNALNQHAPHHGGSIVTPEAPQAGLEALARFVSSLQEAAA